jgi:hypothetical protein
MKTRAQIAQRFGSVVMFIALPQRDGIRGDYASARRRVPLIC